MYRCYKYRNVQIFAFAIFLLFVREHPHSPFVPDYRSKIKPRFSYIFRKDEHHKFESRDGFISSDSITSYVTLHQAIVYKWRT